jgi:hypothetical protein
MNFTYPIPRDIQPTCSNNCPVNKITSSSTGNITSSDMLYSLYNLYQKTFTPNYLTTNMMYLTTPSNYENYPPGPSNIFLIRHAEKTSNDPPNNNYYYNINCNGISRSCQLPSFINKLGEDGYPIFAIITCLPNMNTETDNSDNSMRPEQTAFLSSFLLNIPLFMYSGSNISQPYNGITALEIFTNPIFIGKNIIIIWEHKNIQALSNQLVQSFNYLKDHTTTELKQNSDSVFETQSTENWWINNMPEGTLKYTSVNVPPQQMPYTNYSQNLIYWNTHTFNLGMHFSQTSTIVNNELSMEFFNENINTCYQNCELTVGLLQYDGCPDYDGESDCEQPIV